MEVKYPKVEVKLLGQDSNAFAIMGNVARALRRAGISTEEVEEYRQEAFQGDYDHLLQVTMRWVTIT